MRSLCVSAITLSRRTAFSTKDWAGTWDQAYQLANDIVSQMTLDEKIGLVTGDGLLNSSRKTTCISR